MTTSRASRPIALDAVATVALAVYSAVAAIGFARVFGDWGFVADVLAIVVVGHGASFVLRRLQVNGLLSVLVTGVVLAWLIAWLHYGDTFAVVFPTGETWRVALDDIDLAREQFRDAVAPVAYVGGFASLASIGTAIAVVLGDTFAFRAEARGEALVPAGVLFVFVAAVGTGRDRVGLTVALVAAGFLVATMLRVLFDQPARTTLGRPRARLALAMPAAILAAAAVAMVAWALGPRLPGASAEPLYETRGRNGGVTEVVSPMVDIRTRLVNQTTALLFDVRATEQAYWRVSSLAEFNGQTWRIPDRRLVDVEGALGDAPQGSIENRQRITIAALQSNLVPAAAEPIAASGPRLRWVPDTSTLVKIDEPLAAGDVFDIVSAMPRLRPDELAAATSSSPTDPIYLELPDGFPSSVAATAAEVTAGTRSTYEAALALQDWFRTEFRYSTEVPQGHGSSAIEAFLRQRIGYCEQFAGTFAAMARSLGIPARVSVGFTPGRVQPDGSYAVLGRNAHAWPEIWFDQLGWVAFEPTPGRGAPGAEAYTGVVPAQDTTTQGGAAPAAGDDSPAASVPDAPSSPPGLNIPDLNDPLPASGEPVPPPEPDRPGPALRPLIAVALAVAFVFAWLPLLVRKWRRRHPRGGVDEYVAGLWRRTIAAIEVIGVQCPPSATPHEIAAAAAPRIPVAARPLHSLAEVVTATAYAPPDDFHPEVVRRSGTSTLTDANRWCRQVEEVAQESMGRPERLRRHFTNWR